jgi:hypothetical protein
MDYRLVSAGSLNRVIALRYFKWKYLDGIDRDLVETDRNSEVVIGRDVK